jgi:hypothetical protein
VNLQNGIPIDMFTGEMHGQMLCEEIAGQIVISADARQRILHIEGIDLVAVVLGALQKDEGFAVDVEV